MILLAILSNFLLSPLSWGGCTFYKTSPTSLKEICDNTTKKYSPPSPPAAATSPHAPSTLSPRWSPLCLQSPKARANLIYLHGLIGRSSTEYDANETANRNELRQVSEICQVNISGPLSQESRDCAGGNFCWDQNSPDQVARRMPLIMHESYQCFASSNSSARKLPTGILGFSNGGYFVAQASSHYGQSRLNPFPPYVPLDKFAFFMVSGAPNSRIRTGFDEIREAPNSHALSAKEIIASLKQKGLCP